MIHKCENYNNVIYSAVYDDNEFHNSRFYLFFFFFSFLKKSLNLFLASILNTLSQLKIRFKCF